MSSSNSVTQRARSCVRYLYRLLTLPDKVAQIGERVGRNNGFPIGDGLALCETLFGQQMLVETRDLIIGLHLLRYGQCEPHVTRYIRNLVQPDWNIIEVGANIGYYTLQMAQLAPNGRIWSFEANPQTCSLLRRNLFLNALHSRVEVLEKAAYHSQATLTFHVLDDAPGSSSLGEFSEQWKRDSGLEIRDIEVEAVPVDAVIPIGTRIDLIRIDAEGSEPFIWQGMSRIVKDNPHVIIIMEWMPENLLMTGSNAKQFADSITSAGFELQHIADNGKAYPISFDDLMKRPISELVLRRSASS